MFNKKETKEDKPEAKKIKKYVMDEESARSELQNIDDFFDAEYSDDAEILIEHIRKGMLYLDDSQNKVIYQLLSPVEQKNGDFVNEIKLSPLLLKDIMAIGKKLSMKGNTNEEFQISITYDLERTYTTLAKSGNMPIGVMDRLKKKDMKILSEVLDFLQ